MLLGDFEEIRPDELVALTKVCNIENNGNLEDTLDDVEMIDKMLVAMKARSLLTRKRYGLYQAFESIQHHHMTGKRMAFSDARRKNVEMDDSTSASEVPIDFSHRKKKK